MHPSSIALEAFAVGETDDVVAKHLVECDACRSFVTKVGGLAPVAPPKISEPRRLAKVIPLIVPLAAAAVIFFVLRRSPSNDVIAPISRPSGDQTEPETTFKGAMPIAVIRERGDAQERFTGRVSIRPGDRLRVEVALDREQIISGGVLGDDGSWLELMPSTSRAAGTHFSEKSARVDAEPLRGTILVGSPEQIALARSARNFNAVSSLRLEWE